MKTVTHHEPRSCSRRSALTALPQDHGPPDEEQRLVLTGLARALVQKRELDERALYDVMRQTLTRLGAYLQAGGAAVLLLDASIQEARALCLAPPTPTITAGWRRRLHYAEERTLRPTELGLISLLPRATLVDDLQTGEGPRPLEEVLDVSARTLLAIPSALSQRLTAVLVVLNPTQVGAGLLPAEQTLVLETSRLVRLAVQRALGLGAELREGDRAQCLALLAGCAFRRFDDQFQPDRELLEAVGPRILRRYAVLPLKRVEGRGLLAAVANPLDVHNLNDFELATGYRVREKVAAPRSEIVAVLGAAFPGLGVEGASETARVTGDLVAQLAGSLKDFGDDALSYDGFRGEVVDENSAPIVRMANRLVEDAYLRGASDVHVEPQEDGVRVRYRIDGICSERVTLPRAVSRALVARFKIMAALNIAEHRLPQDGRIDFGRYRPDLCVDLRVSILPMQHGEWVCLRLLEKKRAALALDDLGFSPGNLAAYRQAIRAPSGMVLHCGPTGAGKSMTLYSALNEVSAPGVKVVTAEDPVEYTLAGIGQMQVRPGIDLTFARALRSFLRHDPDIILVGEIRDGETAKIAVQAAMTGHLLLSTLHTIDAAGAIPRLIKLGIEPYLVASTLVSVVAQRLVRRLCLCKRADEPTPSERGLLKQSKLGAPLGLIQRPVGCDHCHQIGYRGRTGIHELLTITPRIRQQISDAQRQEAFKEVARSEGMRTLFEDGAEKVKLGITSLDEVFRVSLPDEVA